MTLPVLSSFGPFGLFTLSLIFQGRNNLTSYRETTQQTSGLSCSASSRKKSFKKSEMLIFLFLFLLAPSVRKF